MTWTDLLRETEPGQEKSLRLMVGTGIGTGPCRHCCGSKRARSLHGWTRAECSHGTLGPEIPCNSHPACIRVGKWLHDHPADVRSDGQGRAFAPAYYHGAKQRERLSAFPARSPSLESPTAKSRAVDLSD